MPDFSLILLAAGSSSRFCCPVKKQWLRTQDTPLWLYTSKNLAQYSGAKKVIIVCSKDEIGYMSSYEDSFTYVVGGATRTQSLKNALEHVDTDAVLVSDVARACVPSNIVINIIDTYNTQKCDCVVPYLTVSDTVIYKDETIKRDDVKLIQTPQLSETKTLKKALRQDKEYTDESSAIHAIGGIRVFVPGDEKANKITFSKDLAVISYLPGPCTHTMIGQGFDVHGFEEGKKMWLAGIHIPSNFGFKAHSDGDVALHALIDALLGAIGTGDIGELFPDSDAKYKDADSKELLKEVYLFLQKTGFVVINCDITIMAQKPKLSAYKQQMQKTIAGILNIAPVHINIKATTTEKLGFVGREEGIAVLANTAVKYYDWKD